MVENPGNELVGVLEGEIHALAAGWRNDVGGVAGQEHRAAMHRLGDVTVKLHDASVENASRDEFDPSAASRGVIAFQIHSSES